MFDFFVFGGFYVEGVFLNVAIRGNYGQQGAIVENCLGLEPRGTCHGGTGAGPLR